MRKTVFDPSVDELVSKVQKQIVMSINLHDKIKIKVSTVHTGDSGNRTIAD